VLLGVLEEASISNSVAHALEVLRDPRSVEVLLPMLATEDPVLRARAAVIVGKVGPSVVELLIPMLTDEEGQIRSAAVRALGFTGAPDAVESLTDILAYDPDERVRVEAATAISFLDGSSGALAALEHALQDASVNVRLAAAQAFYYLALTRKWNQSAFEKLKWAALHDPGEIAGALVVQEASGQAVREIERISRES
jgi:HEAT repeat protein